MRLIDYLRRKFRKGEKEHLEPNDRLKDVVQEAEEIMRARRDQEAGFVRAADRYPGREGHRARIKEVLDQVPQRDYPSMKELDAENFDGDGNCR